MYFYAITLAMFSFLKSLFRSNKATLEANEPMKKFLIVGLGNIGAEYRDTRHNVGFKILDRLATSEKFTFETQKLGDVGMFKVKGRSIFCLKPSTYMNRSGKALKYWLEKEKIPLENLLVIADDINLSYGILRIKTKGSDGGHNGLKDIQSVLQSNSYNRFRFGVGSDFAKGRQVDYVLGKWNEEEKEKLEERLDRSCLAVRSFVLSGIKITMNEFNGT